VIQPGAPIGQHAYCPVSGVTFEVKDSSPRIELDGKTIYFCCSGCEAYFAQHQERIVALRGLSTGTAPSP
jgi:YHS domain-containing protein